MNTVNAAVESAGQEINSATGELVSSVKELKDVVKHSSNEEMGATEKLKVSESDLSDSVISAKEHKEVQLKPKEAAASSDEVKADSVG